MKKQSHLLRHKGSESVNEGTMNKNIADYISRKEKENLEKGIEQGMEKGIEKGMEKGEVDNCVDNVMNLSRTMNISVEKAMDAMCVRDGLREKVQERIKALA